MTANGIELKIIKPIPRLSGFVESFWMLANHSDTAKEVIVLPDGRFDIFFSYSVNDPYHVTLMGLGSKPEQTAIPAKVVMFAVSFRLLAVEYLLHIKAASLLNGAQRLPDDFWGITIDDLSGFEAFTEKLSAKMLTLIQPGIDNRKQQLFELIYSSNGTLSVKELSEKVYWSSRQINRHFNQQFGMSLKAYCNILRFRASLQHIRDGRLSPEYDFTDQAHFIKEIKKFSGVVPKELFKNEKDRFILLSALPKK